MFKKLKDSIRKAGRGKPSPAQRQSDLLDEALKETFPASDPVSVARIQ
jgi:hypothetical protein